MDFPGGSITNVRVVDGFSNIYWRIYTEEQNNSNEVPNNGLTILKHISRLKELELRLRGLGCLVLSYPRRLGLLIFSATPEFEHLASLCPNEGRDEPHRLHVASTILKVWTSGSVTSGDLVKSLSPEAPATGASTSSGSQRMQNAPAPPRRTDNSSGSAAIYASFISAVTAAFSLHLVRHGDAIPLGPRTLFTVTKKDPWISPKPFNNESTSALTTLQVQLTASGKLIITLQTISQAGLTRLGQPRGDPSDFQDVAPGTDLWLAPSGSIARLVTPSPEGVSSFSPMSDGIMRDKASLSRWKTNVLEWLSNFGLAVNSVYEESWVEVEVWEPFYSKLSGEALRLSEEAPAIPLKRILWPAVFCFRRTKSSPLGPIDALDEPLPITCDPLEFAEKWSATDVPKNINAKAKPSTDNQGRQAADQGTFSPSITNFPEGIESLSRASLCPELQSAGLVYPTPPDGATGMGPNPTVPSDTFAEDSDYSSSLIQNQARRKFDGQLNNRGRSDPGLTIEFGPSAGLVVGSGLYDTNDDDDLFGDMNERDFGAKGITDADFSFFDNPGFDRMDAGADLDDMSEIHDFVDSGKSNMIDQLDIDIAAPRIPLNDQMTTSQSSPEEQEVKPKLDLPDPENNEAHSSPLHGQIQTISPPLSPVEVKKILFPEPKASNQNSKSGQTPSYYSPISFKPNLSAWDQKYGADGKFWFTAAGTTVNKGRPNCSSDIPTIGLPRRAARLKQASNPSKTSGSHATPPSGTRQARALSSSPDTGSEMGDESDDSDYENGIPSTFISTRKRKRALSESESSPIIIQENSGPVSGHETNTPRPEDSIFLGNFLSTFSDWSMSGFFSLSENVVFPKLTPKESVVQIAQVLVDQVTQSSLDHKLDRDLSISSLENQPYTLQGMLNDTEFLGGIEKLDLNSFVSLQDSNIPSPPSSSNLPTRQPSQRREDTKGSISKLLPPHLRVRRGKDFLEALPPAVPFWETFGLEPAHGAKNISAYCIHPAVTAKAADAFMERLSLLYSSCNLGSHTRGNNSEKFVRGLSSWDITSSGQSDWPSAMQRLRATCEELGTSLLNTPPAGDNIVIYIVNPFPHAASIVDICFAFWCLFQKYINGADKQQNGKLNDLVLQIVPIDFVMSTESLVVPPQAEYLSLALEVYSRCPPKQLQSSLVNCAPPVLIAEPVPASISFKLASERSSPLQEGKCLHVACSKSQDQRWISVAWSDSTGALQRTISYCLRFRNSGASRTTFSVRSEIWATTKDIMDKAQSQWRVLIVNTENVDQEEHDTWINFAEQYNKSRPVPIELTILSVSTTPDLFLTPPLSSIPMSALNPQASSTPAATPNPSTVLSPDQLGNAPTPPGGAQIPVNASTPTDGLFEADSESILTDICDESWGVVLSHRLNSTLHLTEYRPALASGYLLRRKGSTDGDGAFTMNVNLLYTQRPSSSYGMILRDVIGMYRDLATLARARGTRMVQSSAMPWHIATAVRAQEILSYVL